MTAPVIRDKAPLRHRVKVAFSALRARAGLYSSRQMQIATIAVQVVHARGFTERAAWIVLETGMTESALLNYANGNNPESMRLPHDRVGYDHGSVGYLQQQVCGAPNSTACWGTTAQCMDIAHATNTFLNHLARIPNWWTLTTWDAAQAVQGSFDPTGGNYKRNSPAAQQLAAQLWTEVIDMQLTDTVVNPNTGKKTSLATYFAAIAVTEAAVQEQAAKIAGLEASQASINSKLDQLLAKGTTP
jgi:hypothetical protein